jgi:hypothetical protein
MRTQIVVASLAALIGLGATTGPAFAKAHSQPSPVAQEKGQAVSDTTKGHAENGDARGILDGEKGIQSPKDSGQRGNVTPASQR